MDVQITVVEVEMGKSKSKRITLTVESDQPVAQRVWEDLTEDVQEVVEKKGYEVVAELENAETGEKGDGKKER